MQFFLATAIQIGGDDQVGGNQWPTYLDNFVRGIETENPAILQWPKMTFSDGPNGLAILKFEPDIGGFYGLARGGTDEPVPPACFSSDTLATLRVIEALKALFGSKHAGTEVRFSADSRLVILAQGQLLRIGHEGLPDNFARYGPAVASLTKAAAVAR